MNEFSLLIDLHRHQQRQGPGGVDETRKAINLTGLVRRKDLKIADIGCGTGGQTLTLAESLDGHITAVDLFPEFLEELTTMGRIYGYRFRPQGPIRALPIDQYPGNCLAGKAFQLMMDNNLDVDVALYPYELVTYGETGSVCQNWMQYQLIKRYLERMARDQTLVVASGHPTGLFASGGNTLHYQ